MKMQRYLVMMEMIFSRMTNRIPTTIYASRLRGDLELTLDDVAAQERDFVLKVNPGYEISQMFIDTKSSESEIIVGGRFRVFERRD